MKKRILSLLLAACMLVGLLPTAAFAAEPEEALYAQMLELGIVDADGTLIEDNTFTVSDGTSLSSLTELIEWLNECGDGDLEKVVTVDATGKSSTVENLMYALLIEYQIAEVAGQLKLLASGENSAAVYANTGAVPSDVHDMRLGMVISRSRDGSILTLEVCLTDKGLTGKTYTAPYDIPVEVGMFADFLAAYSEDYAADENSVVPCTNSFRTYTIPQGSSSIEFKMDLNKLRANYLSKHEGLWDGNAYMLFQARTPAYDAKMPDSTATFCVSIAPSSEADPIVNAITGGTSIGMNDDDKGEVVPYRLNWSGDGTATKINNKDYFAFTVDTPAARGSYSASSIASTFGWKNYFGRALQAGVGDAKPEIKLENVTIWTEKSCRIKRS